MATTKKYRDVQANPWAAIVVDDLASTNPWSPRMLEVRGRAETVASGGSDLGPGLGTLSSGYPEKVTVSASSEPREVVGRRRRAEKAVGRSVRFEDPAGEAWNKGGDLNGQDKSHGQWGRSGRYGYAAGGQGICLIAQGSTGSWTLAAGCCT